MDLRTFREAAHGSAPAQTQLPTLTDPDEPGFWQRHRGLRWILPLLALGVVVAGSVQLHESGGSAEALPDTTTAKLLAAVRTPTQVPYSATVVSRLSDDLPSLPMTGSDEVGLTGSHTMRFWYGGPTQQRVAVLAATSESDVFRDGTDVWRWNTAQKTADHFVLPDGGPAVAVPSSADPLALSPQSLAAEAIASIDKATTVVLGRSRIVADRPAYELVITPAAQRTRIGSVRVAVDGHTMVPLGVQVFARHEDVPAIDVSYTGVSYRRPDAANFRFMPPSGVSVQTLPTPGGVVAGSGWTSVQSYNDVDVDVAFAATGDAGATGDSTADADMPAAVTVTGSWGTGRLFQGQLMSLLVTARGTVFVGTVDPELLYAAARER